MKQEQGEEMNEEKQVSWQEIFGFNDDEYAWLQQELKSRTDITHAMLLLGSSSDEAKRLHADLTSFLDRTDPRLASAFLIKTIHSAKCVDLLKADPMAVLKLLMAKRAEGEHDAQG